MHDREKGSDTPFRPCPSCGSLQKKHCVAGRFDLAENIAEINVPGTPAFAHLKSIWGAEGKEAPRFPYATCLQCGLVHTQVYPEDEALSALYAGLSDNMEMVEPEARRRTQLEYSGKIDAHLPPGGKYLEIGPDTGLFLKESFPRLEEKGIGFSGFAFLEPNVTAHPSLRDLELPAPIEVSSSLSLSDVEGPFSAAILIHVLDHLSRPQELLKEIAEKMLPGGQVLIVTHNQDSTIARLMGRNWPGYHAQHPQLYSKATLASALGTAGFEKIEISNTMNWINLGAVFSMLTQTVGLGPRSLGRLGRLRLGIPLGNMLALAKKV